MAADTSQVMWRASARILSSSGGTPGSTPMLLAMRPTSLAPAVLVTVPVATAVEHDGSREPHVGPIRGGDVGGQASVAALLHGRRLPGQQGLVEQPRTASSCNRTSAGIRSPEASSITSHRHDHRAVDGLFLSVAPHRRMERVSRASALALLCAFHS